MTTTKIIMQILIFSPICSQKQMSMHHNGSSKKYNLSFKFSNNINQPIIIIIIKKICNLFCTKHQYKIKISLAITYLKTIHKQPHYSLTINQQSIIQLNKTINKVIKKEHHIKQTVTPIIQCLNKVNHQNIYLHNNLPSQIKENSLYWKTLSVWKLIA